MTGQESLVSYAQNGEDIVLWRALGARTPGCYVDVGAYDPTRDSVTRLFYERGWRGLNIDASADAIDRMRAERPDDTSILCAAGRLDGEIEFFAVDNAGWSTTNSTVAQGLADAGHAVTPEIVVMRSLTSLLDEHGVDRVDFLKIDVEGAEVEVLEGLDLGRHRPAVIVTEANAPVVGSADESRVAAMLADAGYDHAGFDGLNHYFTAEPELKDALRSPASPLDHYVTYADHLVLEELSSVRGYARDLEAKLASVQAYVREVQADNVALTEQVAYFVEQQAAVEDLERWAASLSVELEARQRVIDELRADRGEQR